MRDTRHPAILSSMLKPPNEFAKERFSHYTLTLAAVATFGIAGALVGIDHDTSWFKINLFFFVSGALAFLVVVVVNGGRDVKQFAAMCAVLAFLPTFVVLMLAAFFLEACPRWFSCYSCAL